MNRRILLLPLIGLALGCGGRSTPAPAPAEPLRIAAASDLQAVMPALIVKFEADTGLDVAPTFGASGSISQQIRQGAPFDVFLAANRDFVAKLADSGAIERSSVRDYAVGSLVLVVRSDVAAKVESLADLADPSIKKVALANPETAPYGAAAKQALEHAGLWDKLEPRRVQAETVRQALQFVQTGNAEAGLVGKGIARVEGVRVVPIDPKSYATMTQSLGIPSTSTRKADARRFVEFLTGAEGRKILEGGGFGLPPASP